MVVTHLAGGLGDLFYMSYKIVGSLGLLGYGFSKAVLIGVSADRCLAILIP